MRLAPLALLAALLLPAAAAQELPLELVRLEAQPFPEAVKPLQRPVVADLTATISCTLSDERASVHAFFAIVSAPAWANAMVSPGEDLAPLDRCSNGYVQIPAMVTVTADDKAPAHTPAFVNVSLTAGDGPRARTTYVEVPIIADYFGITEVALPSAIATVAPGGRTAFEVGITNLGNGPTRFELVATDVSPLVTVELPAPFVLGARQTGDDSTSTILHVGIVAKDDGRTFVNEVGTVSLRVEGYDATDDTRQGDQSTLSLLVTVRRTPDPGSGIPGAPLAAVVLVTLLAARAWAQRK